MKARNAVVGIVDYQAGNIHSVENAFDHLGAQAIRIREPADLDSATHVVLPGVGAFAHCASQLAATGIVSALDRAVREDGKPMLGICVGMQLLADYGEELEGHEGLGWIGGRVRSMPPQAPLTRVPHVGWNEVRFEEDFGSFRGGDSVDFYFDHSFAYHDPTHGFVLGSCEHGTRFAAIVRKANIVAAQFHPEKSQSAGLRFLESFLELEAAC